MALLLGPPGVGKTTTAHLVCRDLGFHAIEFNASDTRNVASLQEHVATLLRNTTVTQFYGQGGAAKHAHVAVIMDEVDGMGGADRGGLAQLISCVATARLCRRLVQG